MKKVALSLSLLLSFAFAQAQGVTPDAAAAARELMQVTNYRQMAMQSNAELAKHVPAMMMQGAEASLERGEPLSSKDRALAMAKIKELIPGATAKIMSVINDPKLIEEMEAATIPLYAKHFTADELRQMAAMYRTPLGQKMLAKMPVLMGDSMQLGQQIIMPRMMKAINDHMESLK